MASSSGRDLVVGLFVLAGLGAMAFLSFRVGGASLGGGERLSIYADFDETAGLKPRALVAISGVKVGEVGLVTLGADYRAHVRLDLRPDLQLPIDTSASIVTNGLLGDRYIVLQLGGEERLLQSGDSIGYTESAVLLERMIGKLIHGTDIASDK